MAHKVSRWVNKRTGYVQIGWREGKRTITLLEHRVLWERTNGPIPRNMVIHHKNHDRADNRMENLELMERGAHSSHHNPVRDWRSHRERLGLSKGTNRGNKPRWPLELVMRVLRMWCDGSSLFQISNETGIHYRTAKVVISDFEAIDRRGSEAEWTSKWATWRVRTDKPPKQKAPLRSIPSTEHALTIARMREVGFPWVQIADRLSIPLSVVKRYRVLQGAHPA